MIEAAGAGLLLGLGAGMSPGPLLGLIMLATMRGGVAAGCRIAVSPLLTDLPILAVALLVASALPNTVLLAISVAGGLVAIGFGLLALRDAFRSGLQGDAVGGRDRPPTLLQGVLINFFSPHPWIFWMGIGAPLVVSGWRASVATGLVFLVAFYLLLIGSKASIAVIVGVARRRLTPRGLRCAAVVSGTLMIVFGVGIMLRIA